MTIFFEGFKYEIKSSGKVLGQVHPERPEMSPVVDEAVAELVKDEARRQQRQQRRRAA